MPCVVREKFSQQRTSAWHRTDPAQLALGSLARPGARPTLSPRLSAEGVAAVVGFRRGDSGGHGMSLHGPGLLGSETQASAHDRNRRSAGASRNNARMVDCALRISAAFGLACS